MRERPDRGSAASAEWGAQDAQSTELGPALRRSLARPSRNPGSPSYAHARTVGNDPSGAATAGLDWTSPGAR